MTCLVGGWERLQANELEALTQQRDHALADYDAANNAERQGFLTIQTLDLALESAMAQIDTLSAGLPGVLGIKTLVQGGTDNLHILLNYEPGSYDGNIESSVEWQVAGVDADFSNTVIAEPSGNALGPFALGNTVKLRTRVRNSHGTTTGSVWSLVIQ